MNNIGFLTPAGRVRGQWANAFPEAVVCAAAADFGVPADIDLLFVDIAGQKSKEGTAYVKAALALGLKTVIMSDYPRDEEALVVMRWGALGYCHSHAVPQQLDAIALTVTSGGIWAGAGLMQRLLTKGIGHTEFKDSPLGEIPRSWEVIRSSDVFELVHGYQFRDYDFTETGLPIVKIGQINRKGEIDMTGCSFFSTDRAEEFADKRIYNGDVLMALTGATLGKSCWVSGLESPVYQNYRVGKFVPHDENVLSKQFLYFLVGSPLALNQIMSKINSGAQGNVGKSDFEKLKITLPPIEEQNKISTILSSVDEKLRILSEKKNNYQDLKKGLMQQLLTGKVRVNGLINKTMD